MGVSWNGGTPKWIVYNGKCFYKWMMTGYPYFRKCPTHYFRKSPYHAISRDLTFPYFSRGSEKLRRLCIGCCRHSITSAVPFATRRFKTFKGAADFNSFPSGNWSWGSGWQSYSFFRSVRPHLYIRLYDITTYRDIQIYPYIDIYVDIHTHTHIHIHTHSYTYILHIPTY